MDEYRIFISHKEEDQEIAVAVKTALSQFSGDLEFFISGESIAAGEDWKAVLRQELRDSDLLLLLFTEPTRKWDWCLYEAGLFTKLDQEKDEPVVCMYSPEHGPPSPLMTIQGVPASVADVSNFIEKLFTTTDITRREKPLNANVGKDSIERAAQAICDHFVGNIQPYYACHRLYLELPGDIGECETECEGIPPESRVEGSEATMRVFGRLPGRTTWAELVQEHTDAKERWLAELDHVFCDACEGRISATTTQTFRAHDGARIFRPELYRLDKQGTRPVAAVVMLTEEIAPAKVGGPVFNRLRIAERYKMEVFDRLKGVPEPLPDAHVAEVMESFDLIRDEARALDVFEDDTLRRSFPDETAQSELTKLVTQWEASSDELHAAQEAQDLSQMSVVLQRLETLNDEYRATVARRYSELLSS